MMPGMNGSSKISVISLSCCARAFLAIAIGARVCTLAPVLARSPPHSRNTFESLFDALALLRRALKVRQLALLMAVSEGALAGDLSLSLAEIDLVCEHDEREALWVAGRRLDEEFVAPAIDVLERGGGVDVVDEDAAVRAAVERYPERLEALLARCIPDLKDERG